MSNDSDVELATPPFFIDGDFIQFRLPSDPEILSELRIGLEAMAKDIVANEVESDNTSRDVLLWLLACSMAVDLQDAGAVFVGIQHTETDLLDRLKERDPVKAVKMANFAYARTKSVEERIGESLRK